jgi:hypothetical protein
VKYGVVLFYSTSLAIRAERVCQRAGFEVKLIPTPRQISSDCGTALRFSWTDAEGVRAALDGQGVEVDGLHAI